MAKKKRGTKKKSRKKSASKKEKSWEDIGQMVGKKVEKEFDTKKCCSWDFKSQCDGGFFGRLLFIIGVLMVLSQLGYLDGVSGWLKFLIGAGFALMKF
jgi:hypothetical protein